MSPYGNPSQVTAAVGQADGQGFDEFDYVAAALGAPTLYGQFGYSPVSPFMWQASYNGETQDCSTAVACIGWLATVMPDQPTDPGCKKTVADAVASDVTPAVNGALGGGASVSFHETASNGPVGGNWNYEFQSSPVSPATAARIGGMINGGGGFPGLRFPGSPSLHVEFAVPYTDPNTGITTVRFDAHNDTYYSQSGLAGLVGHAAWDVAWGTYKQSLGGSLGCH